MGYGVRNDEARVVQIPITDKEIYETVDRNETLRTRGSDRYSLADENSPITRYIDETGDQGFLPFLPGTLHPLLTTAAGYAKSMAGPLGRPFRIIPSQGSKDFYQDSINAADYDDSNNKLVYNQDIANKAEYNRLGQNFSNKDYGRYKAYVNPESGDVIPDDDYDTNRDVPWHARVAFKGEDEQGNEMNWSDRAISADSIPHRALSDLGWTNLRPFGSQRSIGVRTQ